VLIGGEKKAIHNHKLDHAKGNKMKKALITGITGQDGSYLTSFYQKTVTKPKESYLFIKKGR